MNCGMSYSTQKEDTPYNPFIDDPVEYYGVRDGTLFVIDTTPPMFREDSNNDVYFRQCIKHYVQILRQKLVWNRQDWMGLILFGTEKWDTDPEIKNILTLQKLGLISVDMLKEAMKIYDKEWEYYKGIGSTDSYPLYDVIWHAAQAFSSIKITMHIRRVIFFTCRDDPPMTDATEKHRIRVKTSCFNDIGIQLVVIGLGDQWDHNVFYKDLEMISRKIDNEDYKKTSLDDVLEQVKLPSKSTAKLLWRLGEGVELDVSLYNLCVKAVYLKKQRLSKETNMPLVTNSHMETVHPVRDNDEERERDEDDEEDEEEEESDRRYEGNGSNVNARLPVLLSEIRKIQTFGGSNIYFTPKEVRTFCNIHEPGIDLIGVKPICYDPLYHMEAPYFVNANLSSRKDNKLLFGALVNKCESRNLMMICSVTIRKHSSAGLYSMIPSVNNGGFYLYKIPFKENVRDLRQYLARYIYDNNETPLDPEVVNLLTKIIKKLRINYDPKLFPNPKLQVQRQNVETLALDLERPERPVDKTLPLVDTMKNQVGDLESRFIHLYMENQEDNTQSTKKFKKSDGSAKKTNEIIDSEMMRELVKKNTVKSCTVAQLKDYLRNVGLKTGHLKTKTDLINKIYDHYSETS